MVVEFQIGVEEGDPDCDVFACVFGELVFVDCFVLVEIVVEQPRELVYGGNAVVAVINVDVFEVIVGDEACGELAKCLREVVTGLAMDHELMVVV